VVFLHPILPFIIQCNDQVHVVNSVGIIWVKRSGCSGELVGYLNMSFHHWCTFELLIWSFIPPLFIGFDSKLSSNNLELPPLYAVTPFQGSIGHINCCIPSNEPKIICYILVFCDF